MNTNRIFRLLSIATISMIANVQVSAQSKWLDLYKGGIRVMSVDASQLDSIVFRDDDSYVSNDPEPQQRTAMSFVPNLKRQTRSTTSTDDKIEEFAVSAKKEGGNYLFSNYLCKKFPDAIEKTETNTNGWDYVFGDQVTQYWENNATSYTFQALAFKKGHYEDVSFENGVANIKVNTDNIESVFTTGNIKASNNNSGLVTLDFSPLASKVELCFYDEIPGYDAEITHFYNFEGETVDYPVIIGTIAKEGIIKVDWNNSQTTITPTSYVYDLILNDDNWDRTLSKCDPWEVSQNSCGTFVLPNEGADNKIQFDLKLTASDGSGEVINLKQEVSFPRTYTQWESGRKYKYSIEIREPFSTDGTRFSVTVSTLDVREQNIEL